MKDFFFVLEKQVEASGSLLCVGLDPHPEELEQNNAAGVKSFCRRLIKATAPYAATFKPNAAFFESHGSEGWDVLKEIIELIKEESEQLGLVIPIILDAKRGDIASTAEAYAHSAFAVLGVDAITLNPYLGKDSIDPFLSYPGKGVFLLCKTSNKGAEDLQDLRLVGKENSPNAEEPYLYEHIATLAQAWNSENNIGLVVGATQPDALKKVRGSASELMVPFSWSGSPGR